MAPTPHVRIVPVEGEPLSFVLYIDGPDELVAPGESTPVASPYKGKCFECLVKVPAEYPHLAPTDVLWKLGPSGKSTLFHPLVGDGGETCHNLWKPTWGATSTLGKLGTTLRAAMAQPTAEAAVNPDAMALLQGAGKNLGSFCATAKAAAASLPSV